MFEGIIIISFILLSALAGLFAVKYRNLKLSYHYLIENPEERIFKKNFGEVEVTLVKDPIKGTYLIFDDIVLLKISFTTFSEVEKWVKEIMRDNK